MRRGTGSVGDRVEQDVQGWAEKREVSDTFQVASAFQTFAEWPMPEARRPCTTRRHAVGFVGHYLLSSYVAADYPGPD